MAESMDAFAASYQGPEPSAYMARVTRKKA